ncbi:hypothetical protein D3C78_1608130 [compost metagenome]
MYTCSCGIFECGGFYVDVLYRKETVIWNIEQFSMKTFIFSKDNILLFAEKLIEKLADLNHLLQENGSQTFHDIDMYRGQLKNFSN